MKKIPTISGREYFYFWFLHLIWIFPLFLFLYGFIGSPDYYFTLIENGPEQPLGWLFFMFIILVIGTLIFLIINSIINIERRPVYKSLVVIIVALFIDGCIIPMLILLPFVYIMLSFLFHHP